MLTPALVLWGDVEMLAPIRWNSWTRPVFGWLQYGVDFPFSSLFLRSSNVTAAGSSLCFKWYTAWSVREMNPAMRSTSTSPRELVKLSALIKRIWTFKSSLILPIRVWLACQNTNGRDDWVRRSLNGHPERKKIRFINRRRVGSMPEGGLPGGWSLGNFREGCSCMFNSWN